MRFTSTARLISFLLLAELFAGCSARPFQHSLTLTITPKVWLSSGTVGVAVKTPFTGETFVRNPTLPFHTAQAARLLLYVDILKRTEKDKGLLDKKLEITPELVCSWSGFLRHLPPGGRYGVRTLMEIAQAGDPTGFDALFAETGEGRLLDLAKQEGFAFFTSTASNRELFAMLVGVDPQSIGPGLDERETYGRIRKNIDRAGGVNLLENNVGTYKHNLMTPREMLTALERIRDNRMLGADGTKTLLDLLVRRDGGSEVRSVWPVDTDVYAITGESLSTYTEGAIVMDPAGPIFIVVMVNDSNDISEARKLLREIAQAVYDYVSIKSGRKGMIPFIGMLDSGNGAS